MAFTRGVSNAKQKIRDCRILIDILKYMYPVLVWDPGPFMVYF